MNESESHVTMVDVVNYLDRGDGDWDAGLERNVELIGVNASQDTRVMELTFIDKDDRVRERFQLTITEL